MDQKTQQRARPEGQATESGKTLVDAILEDMQTLPPMTEDEVDRLLKEERENVLGPNLAIVGFWDKAAGSVLAGQIIAREERRSSFQRGRDEKLDQIVYVQGVVLYTRDVFIDQDSDVINAGTKVPGVFAYQLDTPSQMIWTRKNGSRLRATMRDGLVDIGNGRQRYDYESIRCQPAESKPRAARPAPAAPGGRLTTAPERAS
jgi:hypothetical protein